MRGACRARQFHARDASLMRSFGEMSYWVCASSAQHWDGLSDKRHGDGRTLVHDGVSRGL